MRHAMPNTGAPATSLRVGAVALGGAFGALARTALEEGLPAGKGWPWGTFIANMAGTALLAWVFAFLIHPGVRTRLWRLLAGTGFCGALTTFSTLQVEVIDLARNDRPGLAVAYTIASVAAGLLVAIGAAAAGRGMARR